MYQEQPFQNGESGKGYPNIESLKCISKATPHRKVSMIQPDMI